MIEKLDPQPLKDALHRLNIGGAARYRAAASSLHVSYRVDVEAGFFGQIALFNVR
jgi:hypothetical protein